MVWFQCEDCGENLKKPKLLYHFNRCSAFKLSCIDCGVVFNQESVQVHTSCVTEAEKYGPKGLSKGASGPTSKVGNGKDKGGLDVDISRGLSAFPPWSCSLCNVKATSRETLELHAEGKKHRGKAKAAAAKENGAKQEGADLTTTTAASLDESWVRKPADELLIPAIEVDNQIWEKKRKEQPNGAGDLISQDFDTAKLEKKLKRATVAAGRSAQLNEKIPDLPCESPEKKRKHVEELEGNLFAENKIATGKKRKKTKLIARVENGHTGHAQAIEKMSGSLIEDWDIKSCAQVTKKEKKRMGKVELVNSMDRVMNQSKAQGEGVKDNDVARSSDVSSTDFTLKLEIGDPTSDVKKDSSKKSKRVKGSLSPEDCMPPKIRKKTEGDDSKSGKRREKKRIEKKELITHEVSFREWLGDGGEYEGTPTHPVKVDSAIGGENLGEPKSEEKLREARHQQEPPGSESSHFGITKAVKWKKIIRGVLKKLIQSMNGRLKIKDLKKVLLPLAQKAVAESSALCVDKKSLKDELMRQVSSSSKFFVEGKHVMLAPEVE